MVLSMATEKLTALEDRAWRGLLLTHDRLWRRIEVGLAPLNVSMAEYEVLALLAEAGADGMRMAELAERRMMTAGGFTRLADRLQRRGLIERRRAADDGRGFDVFLTTEGRDLLRDAWRQQHADLREQFFDRLDDEDLAALVRVWDRLAPAEEED